MAVLGRPLLAATSVILRAADPHQAATHDRHFLETDQMGVLEEDLEVLRYLDRMRRRSLNPAVAVTIRARLRPSPCRGRAEEMR